MQIGPTIAVIWQFPYIYFTRINISGSKKSSGDEIANVNLFTMISHTYFKIPK